MSVFFSYACLAHHFGVLIDLVLCDAATAPQVVLYVAVVLTARWSVRLGTIDYVIQSASPGA